MVYIFAGYLVRGDLLRGRFLEESANIAILLQIAPQAGIPIDEDDDPLLDNVGILRILLVVDDPFLQTPEPLKPQLAKLVLDFDHLLEQDEELPVSLGLEIF